MNTFKKDAYRYWGGKETLKQRLFRSPELKYIRAFRKCSKAKGFFRIYYLLKLRRLSVKTHIQIPPKTKIGEGLYIAHFGRIIINSKAILGKNINLSTGVTIGKEDRGKRQGTPIIGNNVWIGTNAIIVGNITIGDDVLIAPLAFVNFDVPSHSIVIGNPGKIIPREEATKGYITQTV